MIPGSRPLTTERDWAEIGDTPRRIRSVPATVRYLTPWELSAGVNGALATLRFDATSTTAAASVMPLEPLGEVAAEVWESSLTARHFSRDGLNLSANDQLLFAAAVVPVERTAIDTLARQTYLRLFGAIREAGFPHPLRIWNHVPAINAHCEGLEQYRRFSVGRFEALTDLGFRFDDDLPAASAIGTGSDLFAVYLVAAREPGLQIENPRQVSAFRYPDRYGPRSPSFSRATLKRWATGSFQLFVAGTASIVGHESRHQGELLTQLDETLRNLDLVISEAGRRLDRPLGLSDASALKVYLRHGEDYEAASRSLAPRIAANASVIYLRADICRRELLLEIEAYVEGDEN
ncbi:MAG TPA: hypothetical protein VHL58_01855 [Thermoanaerobaculia bacterium]|nr:hypothetical protein [Thermoanaerobaculia bacterium]